MKHMNQFRTPSNTKRGRQVTSAKGSRIVGAFDDKFSATMTDEVREWNARVEFERQERKERKAKRRQA